MSIAFFYSLMICALYDVCNYLCIIYTVSKDYYYYALGKVGPKNIESSHISFGIYSRDHDIILSDIFDIWFNSILFYSIRF